MDKKYKNTFKIINKISTSILRYNNWDILIVINKSKVWLGYYLLISILVKYSCWLTLSVYW